MVKSKKPATALFWKIALISLGIISLSTGILKGPACWTGYMLDITGPAWGYILIRGQYNSKNATFLSIKFSEESAFILIVSICYIIEAMQYFELYDSTFDPYDFIAYSSGIFIVYLIEKIWIRERK